MMNNETTKKTLEVFKNNILPAIYGAVGFTWVAEWWSSSNTRTYKNNSINSPSSGLSGAVEKIIDSGNSNLPGDPFS